MIDLTTFPVIDHHCHPYAPAKAVLEPELLAREFHHGTCNVTNICDILSQGFNLFHRLLYNKGQRQTGPIIYSDESHLK